MTLVSAVAGGVFGLASPSQAATARCDEGQRKSSQALARAGFAAEPVESVESAGMKITLRFADPQRCAWALISGSDDEGRVWLDRSNDFGATWQPQLGDRAIQDDNTSTYTAPYAFGVGTRFTSVRACGHGVERRVVGYDDGSGDPFSSSAPPLAAIRPPIRPGGRGGKYRVLTKEFPAEIRCTAWFSLVPETPCRQPSPTTPGAVESGQVVRPLCDLPAEATRTWTLVEAGGPFPTYNGVTRDGTEFKNFGTPLPARETGYYREYTVPTPGAADRAARRFVVGNGGEVYYTEHHYAHFVTVDVTAT